ncbi:MAG: mechanosensitive ion channel domain-containing protein [Planctomycetota bacterium]
MKKLWILLIIFALGFSVFAADGAGEVTPAETTVAEAATAEAPADSETLLDMQDPHGSAVRAYEKITEYLAENGVQLLLNVLKAAAIFFIGRWIANLLASLVLKAMDKAKIDHTLSRFVRNLLYTGLLAFVIISALNALGVDTASAAVILGAAGLAVGLALQGSLSNFAAGVLMIIFKPIKVGDFVEVGGATGTVKEIAIFNTIISGPDNIRIIVPNSQVTGGNIKNYTVNGTRRVDLVIGVSYEDDIKKAKEVMMEVLKADPLVLDDPAPFVGVLELADSSVNYAVRPWVKAADYWDVYFGVMEKVKYALEANGLTIPFPQRDVHMINAPTS